MNLDSALAMIRALHRPSRNQCIDEVQLCESLAHLTLKTPGQETARQDLFDSVIQQLVIDHDLVLVSPRPALARFWLP
jgi:hypothetical protein